ncbi:hypothetical protein GGU10DRAFT_355256 [Lentinula aff. detonsa]|uniref:Secreted protein n=1 Tax=Lentinula aff. detonsa TaxID=2804958 RepID=A0AA38NJA5_9AGAR|nr:hypothetical protein GGU10DRAFT_355256 [Lentinula aff. detonsa]
MMVFSHSVLTTFIVVGTSSSVLALPFQGFSGSGLPQNDVASTATTQAMPSSNHPHWLWARTICARGCCQGHHTNFSTIFDTDLVEPQ